MVPCAIGLAGRVHAGAVAGLVPCRQQRAEVAVGGGGAGRQEGGWRRRDRQAGGGLLDRRGCGRCVRGRGGGHGFVHWGQIRLDGVVGGRRRGCRSSLRAGGPLRARFAATGQRALQGGGRRWIALQPVARDCVVERDDELGVVPRVGVVGVECYRREFGGRRHFL